MINCKPLPAIWIALVASLGTGVTDSMSAPTIQGTASVIDGDTIEIGGERIRLHAIDAPESSQICLDAASKRYRCGQKSAFALADMIGRSVVSCAPKGRDRYKRVIAVCYKGETNLNAWMVTHGWAVAYRKYGIDYIAQEEEARLARRGIREAKSANKCRRIGDQCFDNLPALLVGRRDERPEGREDLRTLIRAETGQEPGREEYCRQEPCPQDGHCRIEGEEIRQLDRKGPRHLEDLRLRPQAQGLNRSPDWPQFSTRSGNGARVSFPGGV